LWACSHREKALLLSLLLLLPLGLGREEKGRVRGRMCRIGRLLSSLAMDEGEGRREDKGREGRMVLVCSGPEGHLWVARRVVVGWRSKGWVREP